MSIKDHNSSLCDPLEPPNDPGPERLIDLLEKAGVSQKVIRATCTIFRNERTDTLRYWINKKCPQCEQRVAEDYRKSTQELSEGKFIELFRRKITLAGGVRKLANKWKISAAYVSDIQLGRRKPGPSVLKRMSLERVKSTTTVYVKMAKGERR